MTIRLTEHQAQRYLDELAASAAFLLIEDVYLPGYSGKIYIVADNVVQSREQIFTIDLCDNSIYQLINNEAVLNHYGEIRFMTQRTRAVWKYSQAIGENNE